MANYTISVYMQMPGLCPTGQTVEWKVSAEVGNKISSGRIFGPFVSTFTNGFLILNPQTGLVSPQFHCVYDKIFDSPCHDKKFSLVWEEKAGLKNQEICSKIGRRHY